MYTYTHTHTHTHARSNDNMASQRSALSLAPMAELQTTMPGCSCCA